MFEWIIDQIGTAISSNEFFAGGLLLGAFGMAGGFAYKSMRPVKAWLRRRYTVRIEVREPDPFGWMAEWLAFEATKIDCRLLSVSEHDVEKPGESRDPLKSRAIFVPGLGAHLFWRGRRLIWVEKALADATTSVGGFTPKIETFTLTTIGSDSQCLRDVVLEAERGYRERRNHRLSIWHSESWGGWEERELQTGRSLDSVILSEGHAETILSDMQSFFANVERYEKTGIPHRRGYLLHGPPGCGKTSLARALATEARMDLYLLSVSGSTLGDDKLLQSMAAIKPNSIVLFEDVDAAFDQREAKDNKGLTFSGLLNAIDGVSSSSGRVLVMTTNHIEKLDPALIRPGRADLHLELGPATADMARRLFGRFFPGERIAAVEFGVMAEGETPARIQNHLMAHWDAPNEAVANWADHVRQANLKIAGGDG